MENKPNLKTEKWYQNRRIQAEIIAGVFLLLSAVLTSPLWLKLLEKSADTPPASLPSSDTRHHPVSIEIRPNISREQADSVLTAIRESRNLRELTPLESGKNIAQTPWGTYFFVTTHYLECSESNIAKVWKKKLVTRTRLKFQVYDKSEIHYTSEKQIFILAFISQETASSISKLDGSSKKEVTLFSYPWEGFDTLVFLPQNRIIKAESRWITIEESWPVLVLDVTVQ